MRKRSHHATKNNHGGERVYAATNQSPAVIHDVLSHRKAKPYHAGINDAVDDAVKLVLLKKEKGKKDGCLRALFNNWRRDYCAHGLPDLHAVRANRTDDREYCIEYIGDKDRHHCAP